jgi:mono/diheme cytochrome c family protein
MAAFGEGRDAVIGISHAMGAYMSVVSVATGKHGQRPLRSLRAQLSPEVLAARRRELSFGWGSLTSEAPPAPCPADKNVHELNQGYAIGVLGTSTGPSWVLPLVDVVPMPVPQATDENSPPPRVVFSGYGSLSFDPCARGTAPMTQVRSAPMQQTTAHDRAALLRGCTVPRAMAIDRTTGNVAVSCVNSQQIEILQARGFSEFVVAAPGTFGLAYDDRQRLVMWSPFDGTLRISDRGDVQAPQVVAARQRVRIPDKIARGRELFLTSADGKISADGRACASCHPDGRDDGLVWGAPNGPRQTPTLMGRVAGTAPYGWNGGPQRVAAHMEETIRRLGGKGLPIEDREAIEAYVMSMRAPEVRKDATPLATLGAQVFAAQGCASCHDPSSAFTDGATHEFAAAVPQPQHPPEKVASFDTPSLRFVGQTAPYFHDGRYPSLRALLADRKNPMADLSDLSTQDIDALEAYLGTL